VAFFSLFKRSNAFVRFQRRLVRLTGILNKMRKETRIKAQPEIMRTHLEAIKGNTKRITTIVGTPPIKLHPRSLLALLEKEQKLVKNLENGEKKIELIALLAEVKEEFTGFVPIFQNLRKKCDLAIAQVHNPRILERYIEQIQNAINALQRFTILMRATEEKAQRLYAEATDKKVTFTELPPRLDVNGRLSNGLRISDLQNTVRELGGYFRKGKRHSYVIVFVGKQRSIAVGGGIAEEATLADIAKLAGISKAELRAILNRGKKKFSVYA
jgi:flagellar biosynthesis/type III secretory pathway chaperone